MNSPLYVQPLQPSSIVWKTCANLPISMNSGHAVVINGKVYYGGGLTDTEPEGDDGLADNLVYCYDPLQDNWISLPPLKVRNFGLGRINGELVAVGGIHKNYKIRKVRNKVYTFDDVGQHWSKRIPPMPTARCIHSVVSLKSALIVAGGQDRNSDYSNAVEIFRTEEGEWYRAKSLPVHVLNMSMAVLQDTCYVVGGFRDESLCQVYSASITDLLSNCLLYTSPSPRDATLSRMPSSA